MTEEMRLMTRRLAGLEMAVSRLQLAMGGISQGLEAALASPLKCAGCNIDVTHVQTCPIADCACGFPATLGEPDPKE